MHEIAITTPPKLDPAAARMTDLHSLANVLNIISLHLAELEIDFPDGSEALREVSDQIATLNRRFREEDDLLAPIQELRETEFAVTRVVDELLDAEAFEEGANRLRAARENFVSIYSILNVRLDEFVRRLHDPDIRVSIPAETIRRELHDVFSAIQKNSGDRYYIRFNIALKEQRDYYIDIRIESENPDGSLYIPLRFKDVLRDLLANARKYTEPGGRISMGVFQTRTHTRAVIEDSGCGIPEDELEAVASFRYRASNVRDRPTMGGGFGLTKAVWLVLRWGGSFRIASAIGTGTRITLEIPNNPTSRPTI